MARDTRHRPWSWVAEGIVAAGRGLALCGLMLVGVAILADLVLALVVLVRGGPAIAGHSGNLTAVPAPPSLGPAGPGGTGFKPWLLLAILLIPVSVIGVRWLAGLTRSLARQWCDVEIAVPYRPPLGGEEVSRWLRLWRQSRRLLTDPA